MARYMNWKQKLTVFFVVSFLALLAYVFTSGCHETVIRLIQQEYMALPESERRDSAWADRFLYWAAFKGNVCGEWKVAASMYREFCGMPKDYRIRCYDFAVSPAFKGNNGNSLQGKCSPDGRTGWGPLHPDAPDAFYDYICLIEPNEVGATTGREATVYYMLFYDWHMQHTMDHVPHPKFNKYWDKIRQKAIDGRVGFAGIPYFDFYAKKALPWVEPK